MSKTINVNVYHHRKKQEPVISNELKQVSVLSNDHDGAIAGGKIGFTLTNGKKWGVDIGLLVGGIVGKIIRR